MAETEGFAANCVDFETWEEQGASVFTEGARAKDEINR